MPRRFSVIVISAAPLRSAVDILRQLLTGKSNGELEWNLFQCHAGAAITHACHALTQATRSCENSAVDNYDSYQVNPQNQALRSGPS